MKYAPLIVKIALALLLFACRANTDLAIAYGGLAVLFQPLIKIQLGRQLWNTVDVALGVLLLASAAWEVYRLWNQRSAPR